MTTTPTIPASAQLIQVEAHFLKLSDQWSPLKENTNGGFNVKCPWCFDSATFFVASSKENLLFKCWHAECKSKGKVKGVSKYIKEVCPTPFWEEFAKACSPFWQRIWGKGKAIVISEVKTGESAYPSLFDEKEDA